MKANFTTNERILVGGFQTAKRIPISFDENRRKMLMEFKSFRHPGPGIPSYLINEDHDVIVFGSDRILIKKTREV